MEINAVVRIAIAGAAGRMGRNLVKATHQTKTRRLVLVQSVLSHR